jgi:hypothetical protein
MALTASVGIHSLVRFTDVCDLDAPVFSCDFPLDLVASKPPPLDFETPLIFKFYLLARVFASLRTSLSFIS